MVRIFGIHRHSAPNDYRGDFSLATLHSLWWTVSARESSNDVSAVIRQNPELVNMLQLEHIAGLKCGNSAMHGM